jgi:hypothetical protein
LAYRGPRRGGAPEGRVWEGMPARRLEGATRPIDEAHKLTAPTFDFLHHIMNFVTDQTLL